HTATPTTSTLSLHDALPISTVHLKLHWVGGSHTELTVAKNRTGYHNHINSQEVTELIRELALVCEDTSIVSIVNRLGYRTGNGRSEEHTSELQSLRHLVCRL